jgi:hypothetical protein
MMTNQMETVKLARYQIKRCLLILSTNKAKFEYPKYIDIKKRSRTFLWETNQPKKHRMKL